MTDAILVPPEWERLASDAATGTVLAIGGVDSGKSVFIRWLAGRLAGCEATGGAGPGEDDGAGGSAGAGQDARPDCWSGDEAVSSEPDACPVGRPALSPTTGTEPSAHRPSSRVEWPVVSFIAAHAASPDARPVAWPVTQPFTQPVTQPVTSPGARPVTRPVAWPIAWIDGDIGQPALGPPACQHLALLGDPGEIAAPDDDKARRPGAMLLPPPVASFFVGTVSPVGRLLPALVGLKRLHERAQAAGTRTALVDTSGFVAERAGGAALKEWIMELLRPSLVVAMVRGTELDHLLAPLARDRRIRLAVLPVCEAVRRRSPEKRAERRARQFRQAFAPPVRLDVRLDELAVWGLESAAKSSLGALLDGDGFILALCLLLERRGRDFSLLLSRAIDPASAFALRFGPLRLDPATGLTLTS